MKKLNVIEEVANISITNTDRYRAAYYEHYTGGNYWTNPVNYDITINRNTSTPSIYYILK